MGTQDLLPEHDAQDAPAAISSGARASIALVQHTLAEYDAVEAGLVDLETKFKDVVFAVGTADGMAEAKAARVEIRAPRFAVDKAAKAAKAPLNALKSEIDSRALAITNRLVDLETPVHEQIKAEEERAAAERAARVAAKAAAAAKAQTAIDDVRRMAVLAATMSAAEVDLLRSKLDALEFTNEEFGERTGEALQAKMQVLDTLDTLHTSAVAREEVEARARADREELDRMRAENAERDRLANAKRDSEAKAERDRRDEESRQAQKKLDDERDAFRLEQEEARQARAADEARLKAEREDLEASRRKEQQRRDDALAEERRVQDQAAADAREAKAKAERDAAEAEQRRLDKVAADRRAEEDRLATEKRAADEAAHHAEQRGRASWRVLLASVCELVDNAVTDDAEILGRAEVAIANATGVKL